ncbi:ElyC/SanA/YdcF family protein [Brevibacterium sp.]|jgi:uncharacterized SAM-binding protein YcdF (DUF218 family)|uniref:ElyC/SanA/YdcF family protein n=1 Tax=Brevibacterium sp. TaxID=1701 RepID=UPI0025BDFFE0|nr:ElyC/SanA/YdcF family protein [Brevibacterium sp.]
MFSLLCAVCLGFLFRRMWAEEPRRLRNAAVFLLTCYFAVSAVLELIALLLPGAAGFLVLGVLFLFPLSVLVLSGVLIRNGMRMFRREGRSLGNSLSLLAGIGLLAAPAVAIPLALTLSPLGIAGAMLLFLVCAHLGTAFLVFLTFARLYARRRPRPEPDAVVVLGSRLIRGEVPPLLRARLDRGRFEFEQQLAAGAAPLYLVPSGGQGQDEPRPEGEAMAEYLRDSGVPAGAVLAEDRARTTEENLLFSRRLVDERNADGQDAGGRQGPAGGHLLVVTNGYHVPRTALLSRAVGIDADAVGARTARYFVPSAFLREFVAVANMHRRLHVLLLLPSILLTGAFGWLLWNLN